MSDIVVIGGGAAGMMAAYSAASCGAKVTLLEKNEKLGKKVFITGKGRCNVTNACEDEDFFKNIVTNSKFMYSAYYGFNNYMLMELIKSAGCPLKIERGNRVFPVSDHSSDIITALAGLLKSVGVNVVLNTEVLSVDDYVVHTKKFDYHADKIIVATGGLSYSSTGSTGDGYIFARKMGHTVKDTRGALVPLVVKEEDCLQMQGLSLKNVTLKIEVQGEKKAIYEGFGEMLFTHFGISGPLVLTGSSYYQSKCTTKEAKISIDLKSALSFEELDNRILRDFSDNINKSFKNSLDKLLPGKMIPVIVRRSGIDENKKVNEITKEERQNLVNLLKNYTLTAIGVRDINEAIITQGGINVKEINPSTMESKIKPNVYFAGEVIDVDALTGGFNLQIAFSTGYLAGQSAATS